ncbi:4,5-DOPA dioxygenase extradiol [Flavobacterium psychrotrophum]|uniref:4,5-DOPA-extradiol-dioxygenase n=1 Tax=Flavobacterium psychrotrophum TaxID=2294119 RepID=UPI000E32313F|nr:4,5-DOPA dioxygenase extradiol [Flavobacterium psychrotrophum]
MNRKQFLQTLAALPLTGAAAKVGILGKLAEPLENTAPMPVLFLGHGSPMNAIEENEFVANFRKVAKEIPKPNAILCISAHWETRGTFVTAMKNPPTIHDFGGFPKPLFDVQYPAPGSPELAQQTKELIKSVNIGLDEHWGLDHGAWSVIKHLYPKADVPIIQFSIDYTKGGQYHYDLGKELAALRKKGILIIGSGNMVHNLGKMDWKYIHDTYGFDWALEANNKMMGYIKSGDHKPLINFKSQGKSWDLAIPSPEHYLPLLYTMALKGANEKVTIFNDKPVAGSLTMTSVKIG